MRWPPEMPSDLKFYCSFRPAVRSPGRGINMELGPRCVPHLSASTGARNQSSGCPGKAACPLLRAALFWGAGLGLPWEPDLHQGLGPEWGLMGSPRVRVRGKPKK